MTIDLIYRYYHFSLVSVFFSNIFGFFFYFSSILFICIPLGIWKNCNRLDLNFKVCVPSVVLKRFHVNFSLHGQKTDKGHIGSMINKCFQSDFFPIHSDPSLYRKVTSVCFFSLIYLRKM